MWEGGDKFDAEAYFRRIGYSGSRTANLETLRAIHLAHATSIPFENLDPLLGKPVLLDAASLQEKILHRGRGGYCFEQNLLLAVALQHCGFHVSGLAARVVWNQPADIATARTHMLLKVDIGGAVFLADVGFGAVSLTSPLRFEPEIEQATPHEPFRLRPVGSEYLMEVSLRGEWMPLYRFDLTEHSLNDYEVANWYVCTHPKSFFTFSLIAARPDVDRRYTFRDAEFAVHHVGGETSRRRIESATELRRVLEESFLITLPDDEDVDRVLERVVERSQSR